MSGFKEHPSDSLIAEGPDGAPSLLQVDEEGSLLVSLSSGSTGPSTGIETTSPTILSVLVELLREVRKGNMYLALLTGEEIHNSDVEE